MDYSNKHTGFKRIWLATANSWRALVWLSKNEAAFRQELVVFPLLVALSFCFEISLLEQVAMVAVLLLVLFAEVMNTAIEAAIDRIGTEHHKLSGLAKDLGSLAVAISMLIAALTWLAILLS